MRAAKPDEWASRYNAATISPRKHMTHWHEFLASQGAIISDGVVTSFGDTQSELLAAAHSNILADLSHLSLLQVDGEDRVNFLQGQVTNDIRLLDGGHSQYAGYCSPKGRLLALFFAFAYGGRIYLQFHGALKEPILKRLKMYVLRTKVNISDASENIRCFGMAGNDVTETLKTIFGDVPAQSHELISTDKGTLVRLSGADATPRYQVYVAAEHADDMWNKLAPNLKTVGKAGWDWLEIQSGIPEISPATQEEFVPQMINMDALDAINYKKGCYTGQEIVARTHYLGKIKRRTQLSHIDIEQMPMAGDDVSGPDNAPVGKIVRSAPSPAGGFDVLAELRLESLQSSLLWQGVELQIKPLPYDLD
jgi:folate-binding protein YgfZ